ncbi:MAG TPA: SpoIIE family protein phosphatase [Paludibaculum sp.]|jgi:sigma-B regulation protein RsbU (phosphoserine phosphatase)
MLSGWLHQLRALGWMERLLAVFLLLTVCAYLFNWSNSTQLFLQIMTCIFGLAFCWKLGLRFIRQAIWRLRNRLIVAYLFIALVPVLLLALLTAASVWMISGQIAAYLLNVEMDRRVASLRQTAGSLARVPPQQRAEAVRRAGFVFRDRFPGLEILVHDSDGREVRYPEDSALGVPPKGHTETAGVVIREKIFYLWAHAGGPESEVVVLAPITRTLLQGLVPRMGRIVLQPIGVQPGEARELDFRLHPPVPGEVLDAALAASTFVPQPVNLFDLPLKWGVRLAVPLWEQPGEVKTIFLGAVTRISGPLNIVFGIDTNSGLPSMVGAFTLVVLLFFSVEIASAWVGLSLSRTITSAVHDLYEATVRIRQGDLTHRIQVNGNDQLAELGTSFNIMSGNLERLLAGEKERQRMQAELEIAREVQAQLHPKLLPALGGLRVTSICNAARMVSGDYYDYQALGEQRLALCLGDVAGKGISAALLMATLQSAMRSQLRQCMETSGHELSTARLVSNLNQQLYASTAPEKYATFFFSLYDDQTATLAYTNAGHLSPFLVRGGQAIPLESTGMVVGAFPFAKYGECSIQLESGDLLVCYTDGITEPENPYGEDYGEQRLIELLIQNADKDAAEIADLVVADVTRWTGASELQDDMTLLLARKL